MLGIRLFRVWAGKINAPRFRSGIGYYSTDLWKVFALTG